MQMKVLKQPYLHNFETFSSHIELTFRFNN